MYRSGSIVRIVCRSRSPKVSCRTQNYRHLATRTAQSHALNRLSSGSWCVLRGQASRHQLESYTPRLAYSTDGSLPHHYKIPLPALSPTMEMGTLVRWTKEEGDQLSEGDLLAEIETDKATMGFETPEEGYLAKILVQGGSKDVPLGKLLCIIVDNQEDIAAFANYNPSASENAATPVPSSGVSAPPPPQSAAPAKDYPKHFPVKLPALSPTMEKGNIKEWLKAVGDELSEGDILVQIETDKATMDFETPEEGFLAKILVPGGGKDIQLGEVVCVIVEDKDDIPAFSDYTPAPVGAPAPSTPAPPPPSGPTPTPTAPKPTPAVPSAPTPAPVTASGGRIFASPLARKLAADKNIDLSLVTGSGPEGRIRETDILNFVPPAAPAADAVPAPAVTVTAPAPGAIYTDIPLSNMRKVIAQRLIESKTTIPHYYLTVDVEMDNINRLRTELNTLLQKENVKLSVNDFLIKASALACRKVPEANSSWQESFIRQFHTVDMCVAVATDEGLITPIVSQAEKKGLATINQEVKDLATKAREKKLQPHEFQGGTFTISNLGMYGIKHFAAVINPPQACILAVGGLNKTLIPDADHENGYRPVSVMTVTLSCDHRVVDGAVGAQWLQQFKRFMEKPESMLL